MMELGPKKGETGNPLPSVVHSNGGYHPYIDHYMVCSWMD